MYITQGITIIIIMKDKEYYKYNYQEKTEGD